MLRDLFKRGWFETNNICVKGQDTFRFHNAAFGPSVHGMNIGKRNNELQWTELGNNRVACGLDWETKGIVGGENRPAWEKRVMSITVGGDATHQKGVCLGLGFGSCPETAC